MSPHPCHHGRSSARLLWLILNMFLQLLQGSLSEISVIQKPSIVISEIGKNITLDCLFTHTPEQKVTGPILYWYYGSDDLLYPHPIPQYENRVIVLNPDKNSSNRSILLLNVQWEDNRKYHCMLSYSKSGKGARTRGTGVTLLLHGPMMFNISSESQNNLLCNITVSSNVGFNLTVLCNGVEVAKGQSEIHDKFTVLSALVDEDMECECQLNLHSSMVLSQSYIRKSRESQWADLPEPMFLYAVILSIPFSITLIIVITAPIFDNMKTK